MDYDQLIMRVANGDMEALEALYDALYSPIFTLIFSMTQDSASAADLTQDTFLKVYQYAPTFQASGKGRAWVMKIGRNLALNDIRVKQRQTFELPEDLEARPEIDRDLLLFLKESMAVMGPTESDIVLLRTHGYTHRETAEILGLPLGTVCWKYAAAQKKLKRQWNSEV